MRRLLHDVETEVRIDLVLVLLTAFSALTLASLAFEERVGVVGKFINRFCVTLTGTIGSWVWPVLLLTWCICSFLKRQPLGVSGRIVGIVLFLMSVLGSLHLMCESLPTLSWSDFQIVANPSADRAFAGGLLGGVISTLLYKGLGYIGTILLLFTLFVASILLIFRISLMQLLKFILQGMIMFVSLVAKRVSQFFRFEKKHNSSEIVESSKEAQDSMVILNHRSMTPPDVSESDEPKPEEEEEDVEYTQLPVIAATEDYELPSTTILQRGYRTRGSNNNKGITQRARKLEETLANFGIEAKVTKVNVGPTITRFEIQTAAGTKVSRVTALADDIALNLAARDVRMEAPIPGKAAIGIEVPNENTSMVFLRDVLEDVSYKNATHPLTVAFGQDISGSPVIHNLAKMPHLLIAGATGSGKSVCINVIINSILFKAHPSQVRFLMIDPKRVELGVYNGIPHLLAPVVTDPKRAAAALHWIVQEMEKRYTAFAEVGARDLERFNQIASKQEGKETLPLIVVIIDELADLMMVASGEVEDAICRLAQMGRASGIHLVVGTQRPSVDVITGLIKANIPTRIAFAVSSGVDSRTILDMNGAEKLLGKGDMLFNPQGISKPVRVQGAFISDQEVENLVKFISRQLDVEYEKEEFVQQASEVAVANDLDELFEEAVRIVVDHGQASVSFLQRRLRIGYTRAARIIDQLEAKGIVGGYEGSKPRKVFADSEVVREILSGNS